MISINYISLGISYCRRITSLHVARQPSSNHQQTREKIYSKNNSRVPVSSRILNNLCEHHIIPMCIYLRKIYLFSVHKFAAREDESGSHKQIENEQRQSLSVTKKRCDEKM